MYPVRILTNRDASRTQIIHHNAQEMDKDDENDADRGSTVVLSIMVAAVLVVPTVLFFVTSMDESYMDEIFHVPQVIKLFSIKHKRV